MVDGSRGSYYRGGVEPPAPSPEMVGASRRHLTERYASGVDLLLWETEKRLIPDLDAIRSVPEAAAAEERQRWLEGRRALPYTTAASQRPEAGKAARRAEAAHRAKAAGDEPAGRPEAGHASGGDPGEQRP